MADDRLEPYNRSLSSCTKTGGYKKSEDGEFLATGGPPYILLTPESCDSYCQKIGLVTIMFFFDFYFLMFLRNFLLCFPY